MVVYGYLRKADLQYVDWETLNHFHTDTWYHAQSQELLCNGMVMQSQLAHGARFSHAQGSKRQSVFSSLFWMSTLAWRLRMDYDLLRVAASVARRARQRRNHCTTAGS
jgi:hypothetical protein